MHSEGVPVGVEILAEAEMINRPQKGQYHAPELGCRYRIGFHTDSSDFRTASIDEVILDLKLISRQR
jgi:hypothetical protein